MKNSPHMSLRIWDEEKDLYDHEQLANNFAKIDVHNHTDGQGVPIPIGGIEPGVLYGSWEPLSLSSKLASYTTGGLQSPEARLECGNSVVRLKGAVKVTSAIAENETLFTLPTLTRPISTIMIPLHAAFIKVESKTGVVINLVGEMHISEIIHFDGITFNYT